MCLFVWLLGRPRGATQSRACSASAFSQMRTSVLARSCEVEAAAAAVCDKKRKKWRTSLTYPEGHGSCHVL